MSTSTDAEVHNSEKQATQVESEISGAAPSQAEATELPTSKQSDTLRKKTGKKASKEIEEKLAEIKELEKSLSEWQNKAAEYLDGWQRSRAEFANYKKRIERDQLQAYQLAAGSIFKKQLEILDDLDRALKKRPTDGDGASWAEGIELIYRKFTSLLESEGVKVMQADGQMFDPNQHEAISSEESPSHQSGQIIEVLQKGYYLGDRVLRPALVRVAK